MPTVRAVARLLRFWRDWLRRYALLYLLGVVCLIATNALTVAIPSFVQYAIDALAAGEGPDGATPWAFAILAAGVGIVIVRTLSRTLFFNPGRTVEFRIKNELFQRLLVLPSSFYDRMRPGEIISRGTNDTGSVRALAGFATLQLFNVVFMLVLTLGRMLVLDPFLTLVCALPLVGAALILRKAIAVMFTYIRSLQEQIATLSDRILETYNGVAVLQAYGAMSGAHARFDDANDRLLDLGVGLLKVRAWLLPVVSVVGSLCIVVLLLVGGRMVVAQELTIGALAAFSVYISILVTGLTSLGWMINSVQRGWISLDRVLTVIDAVDDRPAPTSPMPSPGAGGHALSVRGLTFTYPGDGEPVLSDVSLDVAEGETVGIFGFTGSGKSTLLDVLGRVREPGAGTVFVDGVDVVDVPVQDYWRQVAFVTQEPFLFSKSIRDNIGWQGSAADGPEPARLERAVEDAALSPDLEVLPERLDTVVGERGITLSGGQRQRVALARAFYRDFDVLLLDDVLSAVDHATEGLLIDAIYRRSREADGGPRTTVVVSHRVSVLARADRVLVLDGGRLVDSGTHDALVSREGPYLQAWRLQQAAQALEADDVG